MSRDPRTLPAPRARPVADVPIEGLLTRDRELARQWAVAMVLARPLDQITDLPLHALAGDAPALCAQALRAIGSDAELERLAVGARGESTRDVLATAGSLAVLLDATDAPSAVAAAEALRGVLWEALLEELPQPGRRLLGDLADRLACVCSTILSAAFTQVAQPALENFQPRAGGGGDRHSVDRASEGHLPAVIVDEFDSGSAAVPSPAAPAPAREAAPARPGQPGGAEAAPAGPRITPRPLPWDAPVEDSLRVRRSPAGVIPIDEPA